MGQSSDEGRYLGNAYWQHNKQEDTKVLSWDTNRRKPAPKSREVYSWRDYLPAGERRNSDDARVWRLLVALYFVLLALSVLTGRAQ